VNLSATVEQSIQSRGRLRRGEKMLVAVSGGVDSIVLLHLLHDLSRLNRWKLTVAHFNHHLRGRSSDTDEKLVRRTTQTLGLKIVVGRGNVRPYARRHGLSVEMAARQLRHEFLALAARRLRIRKIALAHHADDQVELFFIRLLRGAGSDGLSGMKFLAPSPVDSHLEIIRPLLDFPKRALEAFARARRLKFREDASNATLDILRNRIRRELLPLLKRNYQPAVEPAVLRAMNILTEEAEFIGDTAQHWLHTEKPKPFGDLPVAVQRRVLLHELQHLELPADFETVETLRLRPDVPVTLGPGVSVSCGPEGLLRVHWQRQLKFTDEQKVIHLRAPLRRARFGDVQLKWKFSSITPGALPKPIQGREIFDADAIGGTVTLRRWRPGDRFQPIGLKSTTKLQDLFTNQKIPAALRRQLIVAETESGKVFWVEGLRIGEMAKVGPSTRRRLVWHWLRPTAKRSLQAPAHRASVAHLTNHG